MVDISTFCINDFRQIFKQPAREKMFRILGIIVFVIAIAKILLPLLIGTAIVGTAIVASSQSKQQQENKQWQSKEGYNTIKIGNQVWMAENLNSYVEGSKCYKNNSKNCAKCGRLYNWSTAKNACPSGWRLPTRYELNALGNYDFSAIMCGYGAADGNFYNFGTYGYWWSSSENNAYNAYFLSIDDNGNVHRNNLDKGLLFAVRCVRD
ncbi:hypothetical protein R83H12_00477 [Fibrobacteria bacterium R8-3-H12]